MAQFFGSEYDDTGDIQPDLDLQPRDLDDDFVAVAQELVSQADTRPIRNNDSWADPLDIILQKYCAPLQGSADAYTVSRLRRLFNKMVNEALPEQTKIRRFWEVVHEIDPEQPLDEVEADRVEQMRDMSDMSRNLHNRALLGCALSHWRATLVKKLEETEAAVRFMFRKKIWKAWVRIVEERKVQRKYFALWRLQTRLKIHRIRDKDTPMLVHTLQQWRFMTEQRLLVRECQEIHIRWLKIRFMIRWREFVNHSRELDRIAYDHRQQRIKQVGMDYIMDRVEHRRFLYRRAEAANFYRLTSSSLKILRRKTANRIATREEDERQNELKARYKSLSQEKQFARAQLALNVWRQKAQLECEQRVFKEADLDLQAIQLFQRKQLTLVITTLKEKAGRCRSLDDSATQFRHSRTQLSILSALKTMTRLGTQAMARKLMEEQFARRLETRRSTAILQHWRSKAARKRTGEPDEQPFMDDPDFTRPPAYLNTPSTRQRILGQTTPHTSRTIQQDILSTPVPAPRQRPLAMQSFTASRNPPTLSTPVRQLRSAFKNASFTAPTARSVAFAATARQFPFRSANVSHMPDLSSRPLDFPDIHTSGSTTPMHHHLPVTINEPHDSEDLLTQQDIMENVQAFLQEDEGIGSSTAADDEVPDAQQQFGAVDQMDEMDQEGELEARLRTFQGRKGLFGRQQQGRQAGLVVM